MSIFIATVLGYFLGAIVVVIFYKKKHKQELSESVWYTNIQRDIVRRHRIKEIFNPHSKDSLEDKLKKISHIPEMPYDMETEELHWLISEAIKKDKENK